MTDNRILKTHAASVFAVALIMTAIVLLFTFPASAELAPGFKTPIIAFEFAKTDADLMFLSGDSDAAIENRNKMDEGHKWDMLFPFTYAGFLMALLFNTFRKVGLLLSIGLVSSALIIPFDIRENLVLLDITNALANSQTTDILLDELNIATWCKWLALGLGMGFLAVGLFNEKSYFFGAIAICASLSVFVSFWAEGNAVSAELMSLCTAIFFLSFALRSWVLSYKVFRV